jgi:hypothetical protein
MNVISAMVGALSWQQAKKVVRTLAIVAAQTAKIVLKHADNPRRIVGYKHALIRQSAVFAVARFIRSIPLAANRPIFRLLVLTTWKTQVNAC